MSDRIYVATRKGVFIIERDRSARWNIEHVAMLGDNASIVSFDPRTGHVYAALGHGHFGVKLHRSTDAGRNWTEITAPAYPEALKDAPLIDSFRKQPIPMSVQMVWSIEPGGKDERDVLWLGTLPGGLFRSTDGGQSWEMNMPLFEKQRETNWLGGGFDYPGLHSICVDPRDSRHVSVAVSTGGVWQTRDAGKSWQVAAKGMRAEYMPPDQAYNPVVQDAHRMVQCPAKPDHFWVQHHNGVFRSTDNAQSWTEITTVKPSVFGFAVAVHPNNPDVAWTVPAVKDEKRYPAAGKVTVARTRNAGQSFDVLTKGLPQQHAYDLTFRHSLDVDESGNRLAFGSTTGSLWVTEDQGDTWQNVSTHLPPIYCVRFEK